MNNIINVIKVGYKTRSVSVKLLYCKKNLKIVNFLIKCGIIKKYFLKNNYIKIWLRYINNKPLIYDIQMISKKGFRKYIDITKLKYLNNKIGTDIIILSTNKGFLTSIEAQSLNIGGELLFKICF